MEFINYTPFHALAFQALDQHDQMFHVVVMRASFAIQPDAPLRLLQEQEPLVVTDEYFGEINQSSVRRESDLAPDKPKCDVIVNAIAHAPRGIPSPGFIAGIRITGPSQPRPIPPRPHGLNPTIAPSAAALAAWERETAHAKANPIPGPLVLEKNVVVTGPRYWEKDLLGGWTLTRPAPITSLPLRYEYAYGGQCRIDQSDPASKRVEAKYRLTAEQREQHPDGPGAAPLAHAVCETNPLGMGYAEQWYIKAGKLTRIPAPQIDSTREPIREFGKPSLPEGLGVIAKGWLPRRSLCGTVDDAFIQGGNPLPADFDFAFWNCAHPDLQIPFPEGNEEIILTNLCPHDTPGAAHDAKGNTLLRFSFPGHTPFVLVRYEAGPMVPVGASLDTLTIEPNAGTVSCVYRLLVPVEPPVRLMEARLITRENQQSTDAASHASVNSTSLRRTPSNG